MTKTELYEHLATALGTTTDELLSARKLSPEDIELEYQVAMESAFQYCIRKPLKGVERLVFTCNRCGVAHVLTILRPGGTKKRFLRPSGIVQHDDAELFLTVAGWYFHRDHWLCPDCERELYLESLLRHPGELSSEKIADMEESGYIRGGLNTTSFYSDAACDPDNDPARYDELSETEKQILCDWIRANIYPRKAPTPDISSCGLKHIFEQDVKTYVDNGAFKGAMRVCGFEPTDPSWPNWEYCISKRSPVFKIEKEWC